MNKTLTTPALSGTEADSRPLTDGKLQSNYQFGLSGATNVANSLNQQRNPTERHFDAPADRGSAIGKSSEAKMPTTRP